MKLITRRIGVDGTPRSIIACPLRTLWIIRGRAEGPIEFLAPRTLRLRGPDALIILQLQARGTFRPLRRDTHPRVEFRTGRTVRGLLNNTFLADQGRSRWTLGLILRDTVIVEETETRWTFGVIVGHTFAASRDETVGTLRWDQRDASVSVWHCTWSAGRRASMDAVCADPIEPRGTFGVLGGNAVLALDSEAWGTFRLDVCKALVAHGWESVRALRGGWDDAVPIPVHLTVGAMRRLDRAADSPYESEAGRALWRCGVHTVIFH